MKPHAEITEVWPRDGRVRLVGRIHGRPADGYWRLLLTRRGRAGHRLDYPAQVKGDRFESELLIADLAAAADTAEVEEWDIHLTDGEAELRAGRRLDDVHGKKKIMVFPEQRIHGLSVRPYYTVKDNLSLKCRTGAAT
ncbi:hypothetical protein [Streptomyces albicerus]|uniref:hypothetical protein n=1 Tax=Streptomyces albicerus TaxID=2569859 RepID=UPI00124B134E|nr:hypothetical protein [Streptomyces albicerus]